jgi:16S rRNA (guanine1516-N2)-methyltransferase
MSCVVAPASRGVQARAKSVAETLNLEFVDTADDLDSGVALVIDTDRSWLQRLQSPRLGPVYVDFSSADMLYRRKSGHNEPLGRAIGVKGEKRPKVFDATAGLGRDAFVLADLGCSVALSEQSVPLCYLLEQARELALMSANYKVVETVSRMRVLFGDSRQQAVEGFDVIYIDPMFPERAKTAAVKKALASVQALHAGSSAAHDPEDLLVWAMAQPVERVVIKRPVKAPALGNVKPSHSITGKTVRFDVMVKPKGNGR